MKTALKIGFSTTTQHWKSILVQSRFFIFTFILATLLESIFLHEISQIFSWLDYSYRGSMSIVNVNLLDFSDSTNSMSQYVSNLSKFYDLIIINSFFLGVYYHHIGFVREVENDAPVMSNVLDVPIENQRPQLNHILQYIEKSIRIQYLISLLALVILSLLGGILMNLTYNISSVLGYISSTIVGLLPETLLLLLYLKWLKIPFGQFWKMEGKWLLIIIFAFFVPTIGFYVYRIISAVLGLVVYALSSIIEVSDLFSVFTLIAYSMLLVPFVAVFYSQTLIYLKNETEA